MRGESISLMEAERLTGLRSVFIRTLVECGELSAESRNGELYVRKSEFLGWCRLFAKVLTTVVKRHPSKLVGNCLTARNLTWMAQAGLLTGRERVRP